MLSDLVIDTNVMIHAQNPAEQRCSASQALLQCMLDTDVSLCVDEDFSPDSATNRSFIGHEYITHIRFGSLPYVVIVKLAGSSRIKLLSKRAPRREQKLIRQLVRDTIDRIFLGVAFNSESQILVSHDFTDFQVDKRRVIHDQLDVAVVEASEILGDL
jgi:predicted nucleic acid-binding protein